MAMARPNIRLARLRARRKQTVWSPALTSAVPATHIAVSFSRSNKVAAYLASKIMSTLTAIFTALISIPNYKSSGISTYAHANKTSDEQRLASWIRQGALRLQPRVSGRLLSHAELKESQRHYKCSHVVVSFEDTSSVIIKSLTNSWSACYYATSSARAHLAVVYLPMISGVYPGRLSVIYEISQYDVAGWTTQDGVRVSEFAALTKVLSTGSPHPIEIFHGRIIEHARHLLGKNEYTLAPGLHNNNDKLMFAIQRQIFFASYYKLASLGRIKPLQIFRRITLRLSVFAGDMQEIQYSPLGKKLVYFVPDVPQSDVAKTPFTSTKARLQEARHCAFSDVTGANPFQQCPIVLSVIAFFADENKRELIAPLDQLLSVLGVFGALWAAAVRSQYTCDQLQMCKATACGVYASSADALLQVVILVSSESAVYCVVDLLEAQKGRDRTRPYNLVGDAHNIQFPDKDVDITLSAQFICTSTSNIRCLKKGAFPPATRTSMQMYKTTQEDVRHHEPHLALFEHQRDAGGQLLMRAGTQNNHQGSHLPVYKDKESNLSNTKQILLIENISLHWNVLANTARNMLCEVRMAEISIGPIDHIAVSLWSTSSNLAITLRVLSREIIFQHYDYIETAEGALGQYFGRGEMCALRDCLAPITTLKIHPLIYSRGAEDMGGQLGLISQGTHNLNALDTIRFFFRWYVVHKHRPTRLQLLGHTVHDTSSTELHGVATMSVHISSTYIARYYLNKNEVWERLSPTHRIQAAVGLILQPQSVCTSYSRNKSSKLVSSKIIVSAKKLSLVLSQYMVDMFADLMLYRLFFENIKIVQHFLEITPPNPCC